MRIRTAAGWLVLVGLVMVGLVVGLVLAAGADGGRPGHAYCRLQPRYAAACSPASFLTVFVLAAAGAAAAGQLYIDLWTEKKILIITT